jgi:WD40 repeat protein
MIAIATVSGGVWLADKTNMRRLGNEASSILQAVRSNDSRWLAVGTASGVVRLYNLATRESFMVFHAASEIEILEFSPDSRELAIAAGDRLTTMAVAGPDTDHARSRNPPRAMRWHEVTLVARFASFSPDNKWLAVTCDHGDIWFYDREEDRWIYFLNRHSECRIRQILG